MQELSYQIGVLLSSYSQAVNKQNGTTGSLFQQKTKVKCITGQPGSNLNAGYLVTCMHYIHQNPWKAALAERIEDWKYSSFREYIDLDTRLQCNRNLLLSLAGYDTTTFYDDSYAVLDTDELENIR